LRFFAQPAGLVEVVADLHGAGVDGLGDHRGHLQIDQHAEKDEQRDRSPD